LLSLDSFRFGFLCHEERNPTANTKPGQPQERNHFIVRFVVVYKCVELD
jgi:hypothetical protein